MFLAFVRTLFCESALTEFLLDRGDRVRKGNWLSLVLVCGRRVFALTLVVLLWSESQHCHYMTRVGEDEGPHAPCASLILIFHDPPSCYMCGYTCRS
jgi:hypothetical protein